MKGTTLAHIEKFKKTRKKIKGSNNWRKGYFQALEDLKQFVLNEGAPEIVDRSEKPGGAAEDL